MQKLRDVLDQKWPMEMQHRWCTQNYLWFLNCRTPFLWRRHVIEHTHNCLKSLFWCLEMALRYYAINSGVCNWFFELNAIPSRFAPGPTLPIYICICQWNENINSIAILPLPINPSLELLKCSMSPRQRSNNHPRADMLQSIYPGPNTTSANSPKFLSLLC